MARYSLFNFRSIFFALFLIATLGSGDIKQCPAQQDARQTEVEVQAQLRDLLTRSMRALREAEFETAIELQTEMIDLPITDFQKHRLYQERGECYFMNGQMEEAVSDFDKFIEHFPSREPFLWQRGLALYCAEEFETGQAQFETHQTVNSQDVENAVWHFLCVARASDLETAREKLIPISGDSRVPMAQVHKMFAGEMEPDDVIKQADDLGDNAESKARNLYYAHLYVGLYYEVIGKPADSLNHMKLATESQGIPRGIVMGEVANVHLKLRSARDSEKENDNQ